MEEKIVIFSFRDKETGKIIYTAENPDFLLTIKEVCEPITQEEREEFFEEEGEYIYG